MYKISKLIYLLNKQVNISIEASWIFHIFRKIKHISIDEHIFSYLFALSNFDTSRLLIQIIY